MQRWIGIGNLTRDPEKVSDELAKLTIAVPEDYEKDGERPTQFFSIVCWNKLAEICVKYLRKGSKIFVSGKLQNRSYQASDGQKKYITEILAREIEFLSSPQNRNSIPEDLIPIDDDTDIPF